MISLLENPDIWLISGIVLMIIEVFFGSLVIFLPVGMASLIVGLIYKFQNNFELNIIENWAYALVLWGIISIIISYLIQRYFKNNQDGNKDINSY
jgi:membrane protein implicated in regulation of membrane protease activity|tara:strand:+ start:326 stop:610 length:285 start_codon:yes stop_codon:yes gene_type:complete